MRIPWGVPTIGDATKLGLAPVCGPLATKITAGQRLYALLHQAVVTEDFANLTAWSETDADAKVNLSGGEVSMDGDGSSYTTHGLSYTAGMAAAEGYFEVKIKCATAAATGYFGINNADALSTAYAAPNFRSGSTIGMLVYRANSANNNLQAFTADTYYTLRLYVQKDSVGALKMLTATIQGGTEFPNEMVLDVFQTAALAATIYPQLMRLTSNASRLTYWKEFRWYSGYSTAGQTLTYVADAGAGKLFNGFVPTNLAAIGSWATTNVTFAYSFDDGVASYSAEKTLAQLNAEAALTTNKRYIRLRITVNSDGATQQYAGELNADDGTGDRFTLPTATDIRDTVTINTVLGTFTGGATYYYQSSGSPVVQSKTPVVLGATETTIYECPASYRAVVRITLCNSDSTARTATLHKVLDGETAGDSNLIKSAIPLAIAGADGDDWTDVARTLEAGDAISGLASAAAKVVAQIEVIEIPVTTV